jgi:hypothetical protein
LKNHILLILLVYEYYNVIYFGLILSFFVLFLSLKQK